MQKRTAYLGIGLLILGLVLAAVFWTRDAGCKRVLQSAEAAPGSKVRHDLFGGCSFERQSASHPVPSAPDTLSSLPNAAAPVPPDLSSPASERRVSVVGRGANPEARDPLAITAEEIEAERAPEVRSCLSTAINSNAMGGCVSAELERQDVLLNKVYRALMRQLDDAGRVRLRSEERTWVRERDAECKEPLTGGTGDMFEWPDCLLNETIRRRLVLESMVHPVAASTKTQ